MDDIIIMQKGDPSGGEVQNIEKRRRSQSKFNKDLPRYQCFCSKQYLSYPALYLHMKNKHNDYFESSKNGKKVEPTKLIESYNHAQGYKVYKIAVDTNLFDKDMISGKYMDNNFVDNSKGNIFINPNGNYIGYSNIGYPNNFSYMMNQNYIHGLEQPLQREAVIQIALTMYIQTLAERPIKHRYEVELFFTLLVQCLNKNYGKLNDGRIDSNKEVVRYTAEYNSQYIMNIVPYFQAEYFNCQDSKPYSFFIKKSYIITSGEYKDILDQFYHYVFSKKANRATTSSNQQSDQLASQISPSQSGDVESQNHEQ